MIIQFDWTYQDGTLFTYREPTYYDEFGSGKLLLSPGNNVELIFEAHEFLQPSTREFCSDGASDVYELRWDADLPFSDYIEGQITFDTLKLCTKPY